MVCEACLVVGLFLFVVFLLRHPADPKWPPPDGCGSPYFPAGR